MQTGEDKDSANIGSASDAAERELFLLRQWLYADWSVLTRAGKPLSAQALLVWWSHYKYVVLAHDSRIYRRIGPLLADLSGDVSLHAGQILALVLTALAKPASRGNHINVLQHLAGHIKNALDDDEKRMWLAALADYAAGQCGLHVPAAMLHEYLQRYGSDYVRSQCYLRVCILLHETALADTSLHDAVASKAGSERQHD